MKRILGVLTCLTLILAMTACAFFAAPVAKDFTVDGMTITLDSSFEAYDAKNQNASYISSRHEYVATVLKEDFALFEDAGISTDISLEAYGQISIDANKFDTEVKTEDGVTYYTYEKEVDGTAFSYLATIHRSEDAYWLIQFACESKNFDKAKADFLGFAKTVTFA